MEIDCPIFDFSTIRRERIADQCVCCGNTELLRSPAILMPFVACRVFGWEPVLITDDWQLKTINNGSAYSVCSSLLCNECNFLFLDIRFSEYELRKLYQDYRGESYTKLRDKYEPGYLSRNNSLNRKIGYIKKIEDFISPHISNNPSILDWGGDTGKNTPFQGKSSQIYVYDISNKETVPGVKRIEKSEISKHQFDLIVCSNVLEHLPYPSDTIMDICKAAKDQTKIYIEVPLEEIMHKGGSEQHKAKKHWHEHINFFSEKSLAKLLTNTGLTVENSRTITTTIAGKQAHLIQFLCRKSN